MKKLAGFLMIALMSVFLVACGEVEETEQDIQQAAEQIRQEVEQGLDNMEEELREVGEEVDEVIDTEGDAPTSSDE